MSMESRRAPDVPPPDTSVGDFLLSLVGSCPDGIAAFDPAGRCLFWSRAMHDITGLAAEAALGGSAFELLPFLRAPNERALLEGTLGGRRGVSMDTPFARAEAGSPAHVDVQYAPLEGPRGEILGTTLIVRDVTERWRAREQLRETEERFKTMADAAPVQLWMSREDSMCTFFNQTWLKFTGRTLEQEWGVGWTEGVHPEDFSACMDGYLAAFNERRVFELEYRLRRYDGEYRWILDRGTPRYTPDGSFAGYIGSCIDITERKQMEERLRQAVRARDDFLSIAAHELRTPLTPLLMLAQSLVRSAKRETAPLGPDKLLGRLESIEGHVERFVRLVDTLLDVARLEADRPTLDLAEVDLGELVRSVLSRFEPQAAAARCPLQLSLEEGHVGRWDRVRLEQVVTNLVSNALKFGAGKPVEVAVQRQGEHARITVRDHGLGVAPEHHERIFERFERAVSLKHYGGLGLGLWISKRIVQALGGRIGVLAESGRGASFIVELPFSPAATPSHVARAALTLDGPPA